MKLAPPRLLAIFLLPGCRLFGIGIPCDEDLDCPSKRPFCVENVCVQIDEGLELVDAGPCIVGSEECSCTAGGACDPGLTCLSNLCVNAGEDPDGGTTEAGGEVGAEGGAVNPDLQICEPT